MSKTTASVLVAVSMFLSSNVVQAVEYRLSGVVHSIADELAAEFSLDEIVTGHVTISDIPIQVVGSEVAYYGLSNFTASIGDYPLASTSGVLTILNDWAGGYDAVNFEITSHVGLSGPIVAGHSAEYLHFSLSYNNDLTSLDLRPQFVPATSIYTAGLRFDRNDVWSVRFTIDDFSVVPEPSILVFALSSFGWWAVQTGPLRRKDAPRAREDEGRRR